mmetsp:Transcript_35801/g.94039  ORF Transcript_35801/g.94039 Transcript_35801/m.94039 type:complete len:204 (+) Transcript_35801:546-1157(+)
MLHNSLQSMHSRDVRSAGSGKSMRPSHRRSHDVVLVSPTVKRRSLASGARDCTLNVHHSVGLLLCRLRRILVLPQPRSGSPCVRLSTQDIISTICWARLDQILRILAREDGFSHDIIRLQCKIFVGGARKHAAVSRTTGIDMVDRAAVIDVCRLQRICNAVGGSLHPELRTGDVRSHHTSTRRHRLLEKVLASELFRICLLNE